MRGVTVWSLVLAVFGSGCVEPCKSSERVTTNTTCSVDEAGTVVVITREYQALGITIVDACTGHFDGGALSFTGAYRFCEDPRTPGDTFASCTVPTLPPGRYALGERVLVVPTDGGTTSCEP